MDFPGFLDLFLHLDKHLVTVVTAWGPWVYGLIFAIIFIETGFVLMPFLPGDSLLFVAGAIAALGDMSLPVLLLSLSIAAVAGDALNYLIGRWIGPKVFAWDNSRWFNKAAFDKTHAFYEEYGPMAIVLGRFMPFIRTFVPFVAGIAQMSYSQFAAYNIMGGILWVSSLSTLGYLIGDHPWVKAHFSVVALAMIIIPGLPAVWLVLRALLKKLQK